MITPQQAKEISDKAAEKRAKEMAYRESQEYIIDSIEYRIEKTASEGIKRSITTGEMNSDVASKIKNHFKKNGWDVKKEKHASGNYHCNEVRYTITISW